MHITINCAEIKDKASLHNLFAAQLSFPDWYGANLDALFDCLTAICEPTTVTILNFESLREPLGSYADAFKKVMLRADADNDRITVQI